LCASQATAHVRADEDGGSAPAPSSWTTSSARGTDWKLALLVSARFLPSAVMHAGAVPYTEEEWGYPCIDELVQACAR
jgi:hypothetical protein